MFRYMTASGKILLVFGLCVSSPLGDSGVLLRGKQDAAAQEDAGTSQEDASPPVEDDVSGEDPVAHKSAPQQGHTSYELDDDEDAAEETSSVTTTTSLTPGTSTGTTGAGEANSAGANATMNIPRARQTSGGGGVFVQRRGSQTDLRAGGQKRRGSSSTNPAVTTTGWIGNMSSAVTQTLVDAESESDQFGAAGSLDLFTEGNRNLTRCWAAEFIRIVGTTSGRCS